MHEKTKISGKETEAKRNNSVSQAQKPDFSQPTASPYDHIMFLQRTIGNQAVQRFLKGTGFRVQGSGVRIQPKLTIGQPNDVYEQEADRVAEQVMRMEEDSFGGGSGEAFVKTSLPIQNKIQRQPEEPEPEEQEKTLRTLPHAFDLRLDWFEMSRPFYTRGAASMLYFDDNMYRSIGNVWTHNYYFFFNFGLGDELSADAANFFTPFTIDSALKRDFPTARELFERNADISSFVVSPTLFNFDIHDIPGTLRFPFLKIFGVEQSNPYAPVQRKCAKSTGEEELLQIKGSPATATHFIDSPLMESQINSLRGGGQPLSESVRSFFEPRFGVDFSQVRVHTDSRAAESARAVNALAYTVGRDIVFGKGEYTPDTLSGDRLLAHELTHVVQQSGFVKHYYIARQLPGPSPAPTPTPAQQATNVIAAFRGRTSPQAFPNLTRSTVADELQQRVVNPSLINQSGLPLCGPAAFAYVWATRDIVSYVNFAVSLFENGQGRLGSLDIAPDDDLKSRSPGSYTWQAGLKPAEADWMVLSSIRDAENISIDFEGGPSETTAGGTGEGDIIRWLHELGFSKVNDDVDRMFGDTVDDAKKVNNSVGPGNYILLCVDAHMIDPMMKKAGEGNHWVVMVGSFTFSQGKVSFRVWTWGRFYDVSVTEAKFNDTYYGAIIATK